MYAELEFDTTMKLVAAHARTRPGRLLLASLGALPSAEEAVRKASFNQALADLVGLDGPLPLGGIDEAAEWLERDAPAPSEPREFVALLGLA